MHRVSFPFPGQSYLGFPTSFGVVGKDWLLRGAWMSCIGPEYPFPIPSSMSFSNAEVGNLEPCFLVFFVAGASNCELCSTNYIHFHETGSQNGSKIHLPADLAVTFGKHDHGDTGALGH